MSPRNPHDLGQQIGDAAAQNPGTTALIGLLSSPLALRAGGVVLRWVRRHPFLAVAAAAGAYAWYRRANSTGTYGYDAASAAQEGGTPGLGAAPGPSPTGIGGRASGVSGDANGWSGGRAGGTISHGPGIAGSGASAPSVLRGK
ncbi:MAG: hypothetical protein O9284_06420 [Steroidobacteraceae bacterium]|jgi:hypothetical protein|nr:hypothetical protein [Steroidobacteraceae bacterium]